MERMCLDRISRMGEVSSAELLNEVLARVDMPPTVLYGYVDIESLPNEVVSTIVETLLQGMRHAMPQGAIAFLSSDDITIDAHAESLFVRSPGTDEWWLGEVALHVASNDELTHVLLMPQGDATLLEVLTWGQRALSVLDGMMDEMAMAEC